MLRFAVCDDEPLSIQEILGHLSGYMDTKPHIPYQCSAFQDGQSLLESDCNFDVIFLDIRMEKPDGMETARLLRRQKCQSILVFITVLRECVFEAFEVEASGYLVKPLDAAHFRPTMDRILAVLKRRSAKSVLIRKGSSHEVIFLSRIVYCEVQGRKLYVHLSDGTVTDYYQKLEAFIQQVDGRFFRCHRSYLVNLDFVNGCGDGQVRLIQDWKIPVSRLREQALTQALLCHMKEREL